MKVSALYSSNADPAFIAKMVNVEVDAIESRGHKVLSINIHPVPERNHINSVEAVKSIAVYARYVAFLIYRDDKEKGGFRMATTDAGTHKEMDF